MELATVTSSACVVGLVIAGSGVAPRLVLRRLTTTTRLPLVDAVARMVTTPARPACFGVAEGQRLTSKTRAAGLAIACVTGLSGQEVTRLT